MNKKYEHIMNTPYPYPTHRKKMSMTNRGAQFAPFAALTGHQDAINETARLTDHKLILSDEQITRINEQIIYLQSLYPHIPDIYITYFIKDLTKQGGQYITKLCSIKKIDEYDKALILTDNTSVKIEDIIELSGDIFTNISNL